MTRLVLVHGFTQTGRSWGPWPGGSAPDVAARRDLWHTSADIAAAHGRATYVGYSMGGRLCLHLALQAPTSVERLIVIGATGGIDDEKERAARRQADEALAAEIEAGGVDAFLTRWLAQPLFATLPAEQAGLEHRQRDPVELTRQLRLLGTGTQEPLWTRLGGLDMPVLCIAGELDAKFTALATRLVDTIGSNARLAVIPGAGHAAHLEQPDAFRKLVAEFTASDH